MVGTTQTQSFYPGQQRELSKQNAQEMSDPYNYRGRGHNNPVMNEPYSHQYQHPGGASVQSSTTNNTVVVLNQPTSSVQGPRVWSTGICGCCDDMGICCCGFFCPFWLSCQTSNDMNESMCLPCCVPNFLVPLRTKMRIQENITGSICDDCLMVTFCGACALCQLAREVKFTRQRDQMVARQHR